MDGSPWSFNRKALIIARMKEGDIPQGVNLNKLDLWVQMYDLRAGFITEKVIQEVRQLYRQVRRVLLEQFHRHMEGVPSSYS